MSLHKEDLSFSDISVIYGLQELLLELSFFESLLIAPIFAGVYEPLFIFFLKYFMLDLSWLNLLANLLVLSFVSKYFKNRLLFLICITSYYSFRIGTDLFQLKFALAVFFLSRPLGWLSHFQIVLLDMAAFKSSGMFRLLLPFLVIVGFISIQRYLSTYHLADAVLLLVVSWILRLPLRFILILGGLAVFVGNDRLLLMVFFYGLYNLQYKVNDGNLTMRSFQFVSSTIFLITWSTYLWV